MYLCTNMIIPITNFVCNFRIISMVQLFFVQFNLLQTQMNHIYLHIHTKTHMPTFEIFLTLENRRHECMCGYVATDGDALLHKKQKLHFAIMFCFFLFPFSNANMHRENNYITFIIIITIILELLEFMLMFFEDPIINSQHNTIVINRVVIIIGLLLF